MSPMHDHSFLGRVWARGLLLASGESWFKALRIEQAEAAHREDVA